MLSSGVRGSPTEGPPRLIPLGSLEGSGATPIRCVRTHLLPKGWAEPKHALSLCSRLGGSPEPQAPDPWKPKPDPWLRLHHRPRAGLEPSAPSTQDLGAPRRCPISATLSSTLPTRSHTGWLEWRGRQAVDAMAPRV
jgi:hypothetical protein